MNNPEHQPPTILVVEDHSTIRRLIVYSLEQAGYRALDAADGELALELAADFEGEIRLVLTDLMLPGIDGREFIRELRRRRPGIEAIIVTGQAQDVLDAMGVEEPDLGFLKKPFERDELIERVRQMLERC
jgi:two-component system, cell cycle sensor histidine kinase and response regulator CckA